MKWGLGTQMTLGPFLFIMYLDLGELALFSSTIDKLSLHDSKDSPWIILACTQNVRLLSYSNSTFKKIPGKNSNWPDLGHKISSSQSLCPG